MKISYKWLQELVPFDWSPKELADKLTMAGIAVERINSMAAGLERIIVGEVVELDKHPQADNLLLAKIKVAGGRLVSVISGAKNLEIGCKVPLALPGGKLADGREIKVQELRGLISEGMLCSAEELGLEPSPQDEDGIMLLPEEACVGEDIIKTLALDDYVLELDLTPNRGDCLSMLGVAREVAALLGVKVKLPKIPNGRIKEGGGGIEVSVRVDDVNLCPRYSVRLITDLHIEASPLWLQQRLRAAGMRPINNMVDITNYVMLELGQPLHAFDYERIKNGQIIVRKARSGEKLVTLDGKERKLDEEMLLITDPEGPVAIAGVMGGANSDVGPNTKTILLESASFDPINNRRTTKALGLRSEASRRFEKGVDPNGTLFAVHRAAYLMEELGAGRILTQLVDIYPREIQKCAITARTERINGLLGTDLSKQEIKSIFTNLGFEILAENPLKVAVPTYRPDLQGEHDLIEEVARLYGYNKIKETMIQGNLTTAFVPREQLLEIKIRELMTGWGFSEIISYSFYNPHSLKRLRLDAPNRSYEPIGLYNPLTEEQSVMRTTLLPSMLETVQFNIKRGNSNLALFELGSVYWGVSPLRELPREVKYLSLALTGMREAANWQRPEKLVDFYDLKGVVEALLTALRITEVEYIPGDHPAFHPGRQAVLYRDSKPLGTIGELHPEVLENWEISQRVYLGELDLSLLSGAWQQRITYQLLPRYPSIERDMAIIVDKEIAAERIEKVIIQAGGKLLVAVEPFDLYQGEQVPAGKKSIAYSLVYQSPERTLTDDEVAEVHRNIIEKITAELGAKLR
jgi:phenylalanyl-tRNA synthetase beta chain